MSLLLLEACGDAEQFKVFKKKDISLNQTTLSV